VVFDADWLKESDEVLKALLLRSVRVQEPPDEARDSSS